VSAPTEAVGLVPNFDRRPGERYDIRAHGTEARARRHYRAGEKPCEPCRLAANRAHVYRVAVRAMAARPEVNP